MKRLLPLVLVVFGSTVSNAIAQDMRAVVVETAPVYLAPDASRTPLRVAAVNTSLRMLAEEGDWLKVEFQDPQFGRRVGYVHTSKVRVDRPDLQPLDLSVQEAAPRRPSRVEYAAAAQEPPAQGRPQFEQPRFDSPARKFRRGFIDVDFGVAAAGTKEYSSTYNFTRFEEPASVRADYRLPTGAAFDVGGGVMLTPNVGLAVSFLGTAHQDTANLAVRIPHPLYANSYATDESRTDEKLMRSEGSTNIQVVFATDLSPRVSLRAFGGPSFFRVRQDAVEAVRYAQVFGVFTRTNEVAITSYTPYRIEFDDATGWGFNAGVDVSYFFTRIVGVGGFAKVNRGSVRIVDPLSLDDVDLKTGGVQTGAGLRLRF